MQTGVSTVVPFLWNYNMLPDNKSCSILYADLLIIKCNEEWCYELDFLPVVTGYVMNNIRFVVIEVRMDVITRWNWMLCDEIKCNDYRKSEGKIDYEFFEEDSFLVGSWETFYLTGETILLIWQLRQPLSLMVDINLCNNVL